MDYKEICTKVCEIARNTGAYIAEQRETFSFESVEFKGAHNLVSYVDKGAEMMIVASLRELLPDSGFITEEGTANSHDEEYKWVIDPLDGTTNFVHGLPPYCVSIALMRDSELVVGVVYEVTMKELFYAWKDSDAYLNGRKISASKVAKLDNALIAAGFSTYASPIESDDLAEQIGFYHQHSDGLRLIGSATAALVYVACGRLDAFSHGRLSSWDVAAGALIGQRAGAIVTDYSGGDNFVFGREIAASNPLIHEEFLATVK